MVAEKKKEKKKKAKDEEGRMKKEEDKTPMRINVYDHPEKRENTSNISKRNHICWLLCLISLSKIYTYKAAHMQPRG